MYIVFMLISVRFSHCLLVFYGPLWVFKLNFFIDIVLDKMRISHLCDRLVVTKISYIFIF